MLNSPQLATSSAVVDSSIVANDRHFRQTSESTSLRIPENVCTCSPYIEETDQFTQSCRISVLPTRAMPSIATRCLSSRPRSVGGSEGVPAPFAASRLERMVNEIIHSHSRWTDTCKCSYRSGRGPEVTVLSPCCEFVVLDSLWQCSRLSSCAVFVIRPD